MYSVHKIVVITLVATLNIARTMWNVLLILFRFVLGFVHIGCDLYHIAVGITGKLVICKI